MKTSESAGAHRTADLEGLKPVRVPSWLREGEVIESGLVPGPWHSQPALPRLTLPHLDTSSLPHATQERGTPPKPHPCNQSAPTQTEKSDRTGGAQKQRERTKTRTDQHK